MMAPKIILGMTVKLATWLVILVFIFGLNTICYATENLSRPTRARDFNSPEELRKYLDLVRENIAINGKAR